MHQSITISGALFNEIMEMAKKYHDPKSNRPWCECIFIEVSGGILTASVIHPHRTAQIKTEYDDSTVYVKFTLPIVDKLSKKVPYCRIEVEENELKIVIPTGFVAVKHNMEKFLPKEEPSETFLIDPKNFADALSIFKDRVKIEYRGRNTGIVIEGDGKKAMVLPMIKTR